MNVHVVFLKGLGSVACLVCFYILKETISSTECHSIYFQLDAFNELLFMDTHFSILYDEFNLAWIQKPLL